MAIPDLSEDSFKKTLQEVLHLSEPVRSIEHLYGREQQLDAIQRALTFGGRHVFIYGDRGVGKTSLAQTAAYQNHPLNHGPVIVGCQPSSTFSDIIFDIAATIRQHAEKPSSQAQKVQISANAYGLGGSLTYERNTVGNRAAEAHRPQDLNSAVALLKHLALNAKGRLLIVIDEFDRIENVKERKLFADFLKQVSDQETPTQFIFCGVGRSLEELLAFHESIDRYVEGIPLSRLMFQGRYDIIDRAAEALGVSIDDKHRFRIAAISDGFPHYIHLMCMHLFWEMFYFEHVVRHSTQDLYELAIRQAVVGSETRLKQVYDKATLSDNDIYELALWATADHGDLQRNIRSIYDSYCRLSARTGSSTLPYTDFINYLGKLKLKSHGTILKTFRSGWVEFTENIVRGYVRLRAEDSGCPLESEYDSKCNPRMPTVGISKIRQRPLPIPRSPFGRS